MPKPVHLAANISGHPERISLQICLAPASWLAYKIGSIIGKAKLRNVLQFLKIRKVPFHDWIFIAHFDHGELPQSAGNPSLPTFWLLLPNLCTSALPFCEDTGKVHKQQDIIV